MKNVILENSLSKITPSTVTKNKLKIDKNCIILLIPDYNIPMIDYPNLINSSGISTLDCNGLLLHSGTFNISGKSYSTKTDNNELKLSLKDSSGKKLQTITKINNTESDKPSKYSWYLYDLSILRNVVRTLIENGKTEKIITQVIFKELDNIFNETKKTYQAFTVESMFLTNGTGGFFYNLFSNASTLIDTKILKDYTICDNYAFSSNSNNVLIPIINRENDTNKLIKANITKIKASIEGFDKPQENKDTSEQPQPIVPDAEAAKKVEDLSKLDIAPNEDLTKLSQEVTKEKENRVADEEGNIRIQLDSKKLSAILQKYNISDPDIISNVKSSLEKYMTLKGKKLTRDEAEASVLKAINYTIFGNEEIAEEYLNNPELLINKLKNVRTHKTPLEFPKLDYFINPEDVVDIKHTTGVWRQKLEFEETIHKNVEKLFESLSNVSNNPIKIKNITHKVIDDEVNRYLDYTITLQNVNGGTKEPYDVQLKVPASVGDRYFKLGGNPYIMATQQFLKPVTKTDKNDVRIITSYGVVRVAVKNLKFNPADIEQVLEYIKVRYPNLLESNTTTEYKFKDGSIINLVGGDIYTSKTEKTVVNTDTGKLIKADGTEVKRGKSEYLYEILLSKISTMNPDDKLSRTKKTIPYISIYLGGIQLPLIIYLWQLKGLLSSLNDLGIHYEMSKNPSTGEIAIEQTSGEYLVIHPKDTREKLIVNGIIASRFKGPFKNLDDPEELFPIINQNYGNKAVANIRILTQNEIDPITKELLEFENLPTSLPNLVSTHCIDVLLNKKADTLSNLNNYRARLSEMILHIMYKLLMMSHNHYSGKVTFGDDNAKLTVDPDYILRDIQVESGVLMHAEPVSPVDEIFFASRTIKSGKGGVPKRNMFKPEHR